MRSTARVVHRRLTSDPRRRFYVAVCDRCNLVLADGAHFPPDRRFDAMAVAAEHDRTAHPVDATATQPVD